MNDTVRLADGNHVGGVYRGVYAFVYFST